MSWVELSWVELKKRYCLYDGSAAHWALFSKFFSEFTVFLLYLLSIFLTSYHIFNSTISAYFIVIFQFKHLIFIDSNFSFFSVFGGSHSFFLSFTFSKPNYQVTFSFMVIIYLHVLGWLVHSERQCFGRVELPGATVLRTCLSPDCFQIQA